MNMGFCFVLFLPHVFTPPINTSNYKEDKQKNNYIGHNDMILVKPNKLFMPKKAESISSTFRNIVGFILFLSFL